MTRKEIPESPFALLRGTDWFMFTVSLGVLFGALRFVLPELLRMVGLAGASSVWATVIAPAMLSFANAALYLRKCVARRRGEIETARVQAGLQCRCGYDLTGNVSGVCPECGTTVEKH